MDEKMMAALVAAIPDALRALDRIACNADAPKRDRDKAAKDLKKRLPDIKRSSLDSSFSETERAYLANLAARVSAW